jgi:hypothetical protein
MSISIWIYPKYSSYGIASCVPSRCNGKATLWNTRQIGNSRKFVANQWPIIINLPNSWAMADSAQKYIVYYPCPIISLMFVCAISKTLFHHHFLANGVEPLTLTQVAQEVMSLNFLTWLSEEVKLNCVFICSLMCMWEHTTINVAYHGLVLP